eukprot:2286211-Rhodomonas_salina.1
MKTESPARAEWKTTSPRYRVRTQIRGGTDCPLLRFPESTLTFPRSQRCGGGSAGKRLQVRARRSERPESIHSSHPGRSAYA